MSEALTARDAAKEAAKQARAQYKAAKDARAAEVAAVKEKAAIAKNLAAAASVSLGTAKRALYQGVDGMRSGLTKSRITKAAETLGIKLGA